MATGAALLTVTRSGTGLVENYGQANDTLVAHAETKLLDGGTPFNKILEALILHLTSYRDLVNLEVVIKGCQNRSEELQELERFKISSKDPVWTSGPNLPQMRYYAIRLEDNPVTVHWQLSGMEIFGREGSKRL